MQLEGPCLEKINRTTSTNLSIKGNIYVRKQVTAYYWAFEDPESFLEISLGIVPEMLTSKCSLVIICISLHA